MCHMGNINKPDDLIKMLIQCRADREITLENVAKAVGVTTKAISNIERGMAKPRRTTRLRLEQFLARHGYFLKKEVLA